MVLLAMVTQQVVYAFWKTYSYPYLIGGKVIERVSTSTVKVKGYETFLITPLFYLREKRAKKFLQRLGAIQWKEKMDTRLIKNKAEKEINVLFKEYGITNLKKTGIQEEVFDILVEDMRNTCQGG